VPTFRNDLFGCDTLVATATGTTDRSVIFAKNSDRLPDECQHLRVVPRQYPNGMREDHRRRAAGAPHAEAFQALGTLRGLPARRIFTPASRRRLRTVRTLAR
jgi:hypothetical protein